MRAAQACCTCDYVACPWWMDKGLGAAQAMQPACRLVIRPCRNTCYKTRDTHLEKRLLCQLGTAVVRRIERNLDFDSRAYTGHTFDLDVASQRSGAFLDASQPE